MPCLVLSLTSSSVKRGLMYLMVLRVIMSPSECTVIVGEPDVYSSTYSPLVEIPILICEVMTLIAVLLASGTSRSPPTCGQHLLRFAAPSETSRARSPRFVPQVLTF